MEQVQVFLELVVTDFIAVLEFTVLGGFLLDGVVGEVDVLVAAVFYWKFVAGGADVAEGVEVGSDQGGGCHQHETSDIELPPVEEEGTDIFLYDKGAFWMFNPLFLDMLLHLFYFFVDLDPTPSIWIFPWFDNPQQLLFLLPRLHTFLIGHDILELLLVALDVEGQGDVVEDIVVMFLAVMLEVIE